MKKNLFQFSIICHLLIFLIFPDSADATRGEPNSTGFGYGIYIEPQQFSQRTIAVIHDIQLDWVAVDYDWSLMWPEKNAPNWQSFDAIFASLDAEQVAIMVAITNLPDWALTGRGPNPELTASLCAEIAARYPNHKLAFELFPGANTRAGWGVTPNPADYMQVFKSVNAALQIAAPDSFLVMGGLTPAQNQEGAEIISDLDFLESVYQFGAADVVEIVGLQLTNIGATPTQSPSETAALTIRHYEEVRAVMLANQHQNGQIWVTAFSWHRATIATPEAQATWLKQAYLMMRRQLYIGAAFFHHWDSSGHTTPALLQANPLHPAINELRALIAFETQQNTISFPLDGLKWSKNQLGKTP